MCPMERYNPVAQTRPKPPRVWLFVEERLWGQQFCQMDRDISIRSITSVDHVQKVSQILQSDLTEMVRSIWFRTQISGILRRIESSLCLLKWKKKRGYSKGSYSPSLPPNSQGRLKKRPYQQITQSLDW